MVDYLQGITACREQKIPAKKNQGDAENPQNLKLKENEKWKKLIQKLQNLLDIQIKNA